MATSRLDNNVRQFLEYCEVERGKAAKTVENYQHYLQRFLDWANKSDIKNPKDINLEKVKKYRLYLNRLANKKSETLKKKTQNYHIIALRAFLKYLAKQDIKSLSPEKIELAKEEDREICFLEEDELERLLTAPENPKNRLLELRDKTILEVLFSTGLRVSELVNLNRDKINLKKKEFSVMGKGGKIRLVFLSDRAQKALSDYLTMRKDKEKAVFANHVTCNIKHATKENANIKLNNKNHGLKANSHPSRRERTEAEKLMANSRLTPRSIQRIIKKYAIRAGITKKVTPHTLRHSFGTDLLRGGADLRAVQQLLGHSSIATTQIYTHVTDQHLKDVHQAFHGKRRK